MMKQSHESNGTSPWMLISVLLGVLLIASFATNVYLITKFAGAPQGSQNQAAQAQVPQAAAPSAPSAAAPSAPQNVQVGEGTGASIGSASAKVTIIEFSDFQCPYCKRFHDDTYGQLKTNYIDTGKVRLVYRNFPLPFHQNAEIAAEGAKCAQEQGKFWEYHDVLFTKGSGDGTGLDAASLKQYASDLKLDTTKFNSCLDGKKYSADIQKDIADGQAAGVSGTPSFVVSGQLVVGAQPYSVFKQAIDQKLAAQ